MCVERSKLWSSSVKPTFSPNAFPKTDFDFHPGYGDWGRFFDDEEPRQRNLAQQYLIESARERAKEMWVFGAVVLASAWPVVYMVVTVIRVLLKGGPLDN
jgi:hypothetical protein